MPDRATRWVPALAWLLVAASALQLAVYVGQNWYRFFGPFVIVRFDDLAALTWLMAPFLIAAAALVASPRWPRRRRWILAGVALLAIYGLLGSIDAAWWAWFSPESALSPAAQVALVSLNLLRSALIVAAPLTLAVGIGASGPDLPPMTRVRGAVIAAVGLGVVVGLGAGVRLLGLELGLVRPTGVDWWYAPLLVVYRLLTTLVVAGLGLLAMAAVRAAPSRGPLPELVIALGAVLVGVGAALDWHFQWLTIELGPEGSTGIPFGLSAAVGVPGYILLIIGFALAAVPRRASGSTQPTGRAAAVARWWRGRRSAA